MNGETMTIGLTIGHWDSRISSTNRSHNLDFSFDELSLEAKDKKPLELLVLDASSRSVLGTSLIQVDKECIHDCSCAIVELVAQSSVPVLYQPSELRRKSTRTSSTIFIRPELFLEYEYDIDHSQ